MALAQTADDLHRGRRPWHGLWPSPEGKGIITSAVGATREEARASAAARLKSFDDRDAKPEEIRIYEVDDPSGPLWKVMHGDSGTPNQKVQGMVVLGAYLWLFKRAEFSAFVRATLAPILRHQLQVGMMSVPGPNGPVSEFAGPSHLWLWLLAFALARWLAVESQGPELLELTGTLWRQLLAYLLLCEGRLSVGPRAWKGTDKHGKVADRRSGSSAAALAVYALAFGGTLPKKLDGLDLLGAAIFGELQRRAGGLPGHLQRPEDITAADLPVTVDPIRIARGPGAVLAYVDGDGTNGTDPGYQWGAASIDDREWFAVADANADPDAGFVRRADFFAFVPAGRLTTVWRTRQAGQEDAIGPAPALPATPPPIVPPAPAPSAPPARSVADLAAAVQLEVGQLRKIAQDRPAARREVSQVADKLAPIAAELAGLP